MVCRETDPNWDLDIGNDVKDECEKFGPVQHHYVDKNSKVAADLLGIALKLCWSLCITATRMLGTFLLTLRYHLQSRVYVIPLDTICNVPCPF